MPSAGAAVNEEEEEEKEGLAAIPDLLVAGELLALLRRPNRVVVVWLVIPVKLMLGRLVAQVVHS